MRVIQKIFFLLFFIIALSKNSFAQIINGEIRNPNIIEETDGFLVYGLSQKENVFVAIKYDKSLKEVKRITQPLKKEKNPYLTSNPSEYFIQFGLFKGEQLRIDKNLNVISIKDFGKAERKEVINTATKEDYNNYIPTNYFSYTRIQIGDFLVELKYPNHIALGLSGAIANVNRFEYEGESMIIGCVKNIDNSETYKKEWSIDLKEFKNIQNVSFYEIDNDRCLLYFSNFENEKREEHFCFFNYKTGDLYFSKKLELQNTDLSTFVSNIYYDKNQDKFIVFGNYFSRSKITSLPKYRKRSQMHGYFILSMSNIGNIDVQHSYRFDFPMPANFKVEDFDRTLLCAHKIIKQNDGGYQVLGENMRLVYSDGTSGAYTTTPGSSVGAVKGGTVAVDSYQTFGFSKIVFTKNLEKQKNLFIPLNYVKNPKNYHLDDFDKKTPFNNFLLTTFYEQDIQDLVFKRAGNSNIEFLLSVSNNSLDRFVYKIKEFYVLVKINGGEINQDIILGIGEKTKNKPLIFENDNESYYKFSSSKDNFILEEIKY